MRRSCSLWLILALCCIVAGGVTPLAGANEGVDAPTANWLAWEGFDLDEHTLLVTWEERARWSGIRLTGYRLAPNDGGPAVDVYRDASWKRLDEQALTSLGIPPKTWDGPTVSKQAEVIPAFVKQNRESASLPAHLTNVQPKHRVTLAPFDLDSVLREDATLAASGQKGPLRYGIRRTLPSPISIAGPSDAPGQWTRNGSTWASTAQITAPGAVGLRVQIEADAFPPDASLYVYEPGDARERYGPFTPEGTWWAPSCFGETVVIAVETRNATANIALRVKEVAHLYRSPDSLPSAKRAGSCNLDVTCYPAWANAALGVGGIGSVSRGGVLWCTGALIADNDPDSNVPYFITANHCVGTASEADNIEVYWLYQSATCGDAPPAPEDVPRTSGGAELLVTSGGNQGTDFTLLQLRNAPPAGLVYLGYSSAVHPIGTQVTCIHHPSGDFKRITFGDLVNTGSPSLGGSPLEDPARYHEALWTDGTTEPGSSGSPLMLRDTQQIIGQLYGGRASCSLPDEPDYYGRFDVSFPLAAAWLTGLTPSADVDGNGVVNALDLQAAIRVVLMVEENPRADVDGNGIVDSRDLQQLVQAIMQAEQGR